MDLNNVKNSTGMKIALIIVLVLLFLIPLLQIESLVSERKSYKNQVVSEVTRSWGGEQHLGVVFLSIPVLYKDYTQNPKGKLVWEKVWINPDELNIQADLKAEMRHRAIYQVPLYRALVDIQGSFKRPDIQNLLSADVVQVDWAHASLVMELQDGKGLASLPELTWNDKTLEFKPVSEGPGFYFTQLSAPVNLQNVNSLHIKMDLKGSQTLAFLPAADKSRTIVTSDWPDPGFSGYTLPASREITDKGFKAEWELLSLDRSFPKAWLGHESVYNDRISTLSYGVDMVTPVDLYQTVSRSLKYGFLFILLPFVMIFLMEALTGLRVHVVQYLLVGLTNVVFYLLLLSFSEQIGYLGAYIISALAVTGLLFYYLEAVLKDIKKALIYLPVQIVLYILMYIMLSSVDYALLIGSIGVFIVLAVVMILTRRVDWFQIKSKTLPKE